MATRPLSPVARNYLHDGSLVWGIVLLVVALLATSAWASAPSEHSTAVWFTVALVVAAAGLLVRGVRGRLAAADVNRRDDALADALTDQLGLLCQHGRPAAYSLGTDAAEVAGARLVEAERHFDQQTTGIVDGAMTQQLRYFGHSLGASYRGADAGILAGSMSGLSTVALGVTSTTRTNLMADSVFAVVESPGASGRWDTIRVLAPSTAATAGWLADLVGATAFQLGGPSTHAGSTILGWRPGLVDAFLPEDVSYLSDRLRALVGRPPEQRDPVRVRGSWIGPHAVLAASVHLGPDAPLLVMPLGFPELFGRAVGLAADQADRALAAGSPARARSLR